MFGGNTLNIKNREGISKAAAAIIAVVIIGAVAAGVYFWMKNDSKDNRFNDPLIQGDMGLGSKFTYNVVEYKIDGTATTYTGSDPTLTIVGESGSYYMLSTNLSFFSGPVAMIHKQTGEARFSSSVGSDSITYGGDEISLKKWDFVAYDSNSESGSNYTGFVFSSNPDDAIPYKVSVISEYKETGGTSYSRECKLELKSSVIEDAAEFVPSDKLGKGFVYSISGTEDGVKGTGEYVFQYVADGAGDTGFAMMWADAKAGEWKTKMISFDLLSSTEDINDAVYDFFVNGTITSTDTISTIDGKVLCDVYTYITYSGDKETLYVGHDSGIVYLLKITDDTDNMEIKLTRHLSR